MSIKTKAILIVVGFPMSLLLLLVVFTYSSCPDINCDNKKQIGIFKIVGYTAKGGNSVGYDHVYFVIAGCKSFVGNRSIYPYNYEIGDYFYVCYNEDDICCYTIANENKMTPQEVADFFDKNNLTEKDFEFNSNVIKRSNISIIKLILKRYFGKSYKKCECE